MTTSNLLKLAVLLKLLLLKHKKGIQVQDIVKWKRKQLLEKFHAAPKAFYLHSTKKY